MPFKEPYDSYYPAIFLPALESAGYSVSRADDVFAPRPVMLDVQKSILDADLILCELSERNANVFYELGLSHAIGRPAILVARKEEDIPFDLRHIRVIVYDYTLRGWEAKLKESIKNAAEAAGSSAETWPPPLCDGLGNGVRALASEMEFNLAAITAFLSHGYTIDAQTGQVTAAGKATSLIYVTCKTTQFDSAKSQSGLASLTDEQRGRIFSVYRGFDEINTCADALKHVFRRWRAQQYLEAIERFQTQHREVAEQLIRELKNVDRGPR